jgi:hypothetical protein
MKTKFLILTLFLLCSSCSSGSAGAEPAGFFIGFLQGFAVFFLWIFSLFSDNIVIYESFNNGGWYDFGYIIGLSTAFGNWVENKK